MVKKLKIILVEDVSGDALLVEAALRKFGFEIETRRVDSESEFRKALEASLPDLVLSDYSLPQFSGLEALKIAKVEAPTIPFIMITGSINEETAVECMKAGAWDYLLKSNLARLGSAVNSALQVRKLREEKLIAEKKRSEYEATLVRVTNTVEGVVFRFIASSQNDAAFTFISNAAHKILGFSPESLMEDPSLAGNRIHGEDKGPLLRYLIEASASAQKIEYEFRYLHPKGMESWLQLKGSLDVRTPEELYSWNGILLDVTETKAVAEELRRREENLRALSENSPDLIARFDRELRHLYINVVAEQIGGFSREEIFGKTHLQLPIPEKNARLWQQVITEVFKTGKSSEFSWVAKTVKGGKPFNTILVPEFGQDGSVESVLSVSRDISELIKAEEELRKNEQRFLALIRNSSDVIHLIDPDRTIVYESPAVTRVLGYEPCEMIGRKGSEFIHPEDGPVVSGMIQAITDNPSNSCSVQARIRHKSGVYKWIECVGTNCLQDPAIKAILINYRDITDRKRSEQKLQMQTQKLQEQAHLLDLAQVMVRDLEWRIVFWNKGSEKLYGYTKAEAVGRISYELLEANFPLPRHEIMSELLFMGEWEGEIVRKRKDGSTIVVASHWILHRDEQGNPKAVLEVNADITRQRDLQQQVTQLQKLESIGTLAGGIAHDFNNLLGIILGHASMLPYAKEDPAILDTSSLAILKAGERGAALVKQILTFARKTELGVEPVNVNDAVTELVGMITQTFPRSIKLDVRLGEGVPEIPFDPSQLNQALLNLCVNARDAIAESAHPEGHESQITIKTGVTSYQYLTHLSSNLKADEYVWVSIGDNGTGMDDATKKRIFEPFFTTKGVGKGTGLGLSVVFGVATSYEGLVDVSSELGKGTTFTLYFPIRMKSPSTAETVSQATTALRGGTETLLFVEDEEQLAELMKKILEDQGYSVLSSKNGEEAIAVYRENMERIDLVVSDVGLPKLDGVALFKSLKEMYPEVKTLIASGYMEPTAKSELMKSGVKDFIQKPYTSTLLLSKIREQLDQVA